MVGGTNMYVGISSGGVVFGWWIISTSLSGYAKVCCDFLNEAFP